MPCPVESSNWCFKKWGNDPVEFQLSHQYAYSKRAFLKSLPLKVCSATLDNSSIRSYSALGLGAVGHSSAEPIYGLWWALSHNHTKELGCTAKFPCFDYNCSKINYKYGVEVGVSDVSKELFLSQCATLSTNDRQEREGWKHFSQGGLQSNWSLILIILVFVCSVAFAFVNIHSAIAKKY